MNKSGTLIVSAVLTLSFAAGAIAADVPMSLVRTSADAPSTTGTGSKSSSKKHSKKHKKAAPSPSTTG